MDVRKIGAVGGFAVGAALTLAPLASADTLTDTVDSEISTLNSIFVSEVAISGGPASGEIITNGANTFDTTTLLYAPDSGTPTLLDYELYGLNPISNASPDPGAYDVFNGSLAELDDAYNVALYSMANPDAAISSIPLGDLFGSESIINEALGTGFALNAFADFLNNAFIDLFSYQFL
ncbi:hypothetical protein [Mycobacterium sp.]|uniref:hypothetical protein n=1 Tax=Mycobacterium sp. TaxID=1785 RepID=UPI003BAF3157